MEDNKSTTTIIKTSLNTFFYNYHTFSSIASLLLLPVSASILLSQALTSSPSSPPLLLLKISSTIQSLFDAAGFPSSSSSPIFSFLNTKLSETAFLFVHAFPSSITFLVLAKSSVVLTVFEFPRHKFAPPPLSSLLRIFRPVLTTYFVTCLLFISINAAIFAFLFLAFSLVDVLRLSSNISAFGLSVLAAILYSVIFAISVVICNFAIIVSAVENSSSGFQSIMKSCLIIRKRLSTSLILALFANLLMAAVEALFQYRVVRPYYINRKLNLSLVGEGFSIIFMHSIVIVLDVILSCMFYKSCKSGVPSNCDRYDHPMELEAEEKSDFLV